MKLKVFSVAVLLCFNAMGQNNLKVKVLINDESYEFSSSPTVRVYDSKNGLIKKEKTDIFFEISNIEYPSTLYFYIEGLPLEEINLVGEPTQSLTVLMNWIVTLVKSFQQTIQRS